MSTPVVPGTPSVWGTSSKPGATTTTTTTTTTATKEPVVWPSTYPREGDVRDYPKGVFELMWTGVFGDSDRKWGPFYKYVRAAKKEGRWDEWDTTDIVAAEPNDNRDIIDPDEDSRRYKPSSRIDSYILSNELRDDVRPAHINVEEILGVQDEHPRDYDNEFFNRQWTALYQNTVDFVTKWFDARVDLRYIAESQQGPNQIWGTLLTEQFKEYARLVVQEDPSVGGWPAILNESAQRKWLVVGILSQIMEKKIFNELLFGADELTQKELERLDLLWIEKEGYGRKVARSITAKYGLEGRLLPRNFWTRVDDLAAKTMKIFLPLLNVLKEVIPRGSASDYKQETFLQELHAIIAHAGVIQICTAISPSVFHFLSATPGARMDYDIEKQSDMQVYRDSKAFYEEQDKHWSEYVTDSMAGRAAQNRTGAAIKMPQNEEERRVMEYNRIRGARVKFAVFPKLTRYQPLNTDKDQATLGPYDGERGWEDYKASNEGQNIINLSDCWVVYKQGLIYPEEGYIESQTLEQHLSSLDKPPKGLVGLFWAMIKTLWTWFRKSFWHILCITALFLLGSSLFVGFTYFRWLLYNKFPYIIFSFFCGVQLVQLLFRQGNKLSAWTIIGIPIALIYAAGLIYYVLSYTENAAAGPGAAPFDANAFVHDAINNAEA
ncbi:hypothetical protein F4805DRAFT_301878 [Annulohypoxylon moriforme]|nr:hypothetical protein F4805DRAFT_301878 [Annulohypoxylon moriforme]